MLRALLAHKPFASVRSAPLRRPVPLFPKTAPPHVRPYATYKRFQSSNKQFDLRQLLRSRVFLYVTGGSVAFYLYNLKEAPFTHRLRFLWIPYWMEKKIGDYSYSQILGQYRHQLAPASHPAYAQVTRVMNKLLASALENTKDPQQLAHLKALRWSIHIIQADGEAPNAFILPNGKIFIFSSILPICKNEDGLATVLSHELSHQLAHHSSEQLSKQPIYVVLSTLLYAATGISGFTDLLIAGFLQMPASREMESEADRIGCELMARSCFNVHEAVSFWRRMEHMEGQQGRGGRLAEFLSTHPNTHKRVADITSWMPELDTIKETSNCHQWDVFQEMTHNFFRRP